MTGNNFFEKFPSLLPFLLNELKTFVHENEDQIKPKIQSILLILSRLYPGVSCENAEQEWKVRKIFNYFKQSKILVIYLKNFISF